MANGPMNLKIQNPQKSGGYGSHHAKSVKSISSSNGTRKPADLPSGAVTLSRAEMTLDK